MNRSNLVRTLISGGILAACSSAGEPSRSTAPSTGASTVLITPTISSLTGPTVPAALTNDGSALIDQLEVDFYQTGTFVLSGTGFGTQRGTINLDAPGVVIDDVQWPTQQTSPQQITFKLRTTTVALDNPINATISITPTGAPSSNALKVLLVPSINGKVFGQCTWWAARRIIQNLGSGSDPVGAYPVTSADDAAPFDANYVPADNDMWLMPKGTALPGEHAAFVEHVDVKEDVNQASGTRTFTYNVRLSQYNVNFSEKLWVEMATGGDYTTTYRVQEQFDPTTGATVSARSLVSGSLGYFTSMHHDYATYVWRHGGFPTSAAATAYILAPIDNAPLVSGQSLSFVGGAYTTISGASISKYQWTSDRDGSLSAAASFTTGSLTVGTHAITLAATDSRGNLATARVHVVVSPPPVVVDAPTSLTAIAVSGTEIDLAWRDNSSNESGFRIQRCIGTNCTAFAPAFTTGPGVATYQDKGLVAGTTYGYRVQAFGSTTESAFTPGMYATTPAAVAAPSASLTLLPTSVASGQSSTITWASTNASTCTKNWLLDTTPNGSAPVQASSTFTFTINCLGLGGSVSKSATLTVLPATPATPSCTPAMFTSPTNSANTVNRSANGPTYHYQTTGFVQNTSACTLSWSASSDQSWLTVSPSSGTINPNAQTPITVQANLTGLQAGQTYSGIITFASSGASGSPRTFVFTLTVNP